ncbi:MAG: TolC family protein [Phycisphaerales bacterium]|nr:TolC family protein [Phycisphaerales bacterium]
MSTIAAALEVRSRAVVGGWRLATLAAFVFAAGCANGLDRIDRSVEALLREGTGVINAEHGPDRPVDHAIETPALDAWARRPPTLNPDASALSFDPIDREDANAVIERLAGYSELPEDAQQLDLAGALAYAVTRSREHRFASEEYVLSALRLLIERHQWGPRFFDDVSATIDAVGDDALYDTSLALVNEFTVSQRLPYGGTVSATALASAVEDLHQRVAGENVQSASIILAADVPLLRGAGRVAHESRVQAERDLIYAARSYERFRREFLFDIARDYLTLVELHRRSVNAEVGVDSFRKLEQQQQALYDAGRSTPFDMAEAQNETLEAIDSLNSALESYRLALDRFKSRIGFPVDEPLLIAVDALDLPVPTVDLVESVTMGLQYRLDLQTSRDEVLDARRLVEVARNNTEADLDLLASITLPTDDERDRAGLRFDTEATRFQAGVTYGLPLDREIERLGVRQSQISLARAERGYAQSRDDVAIDVRSAVRGIDSARFSLQIQEANVEIAQQRVASIEADPVKADVRQKTDAISQTVRARNARDSARRDLQVAVLLYLLETGQLRVDGSGRIEPLAGMEPPAAAVPEPAEPAGGRPAGG